MNILTPTASGLWRTALLLLGSATVVRSALSFTDIRLWAGSEPGAGISEAALVIDFRDGQPGLVWGYRWPAEEARSGRQMLAAILGVDSSLQTDSTFFPNLFSYGARTRTFSDNGTPSYFDDLYWTYWVNNEVHYHPTDFTLNSHIKPPADTVIPLGDPYGGPGNWVESSTGSDARPLVHGSWDAWAYGPYSDGIFDRSSGEPLPAIPEPAGIALSGIAAAGWLLRRRRVAAASLALTSSPAAAGSYPPGPSQPGTDAIAATSAAIQSWATGAVAFTAGPRHAGTALGLVSYGSVASVTGPADAAGATYPPVSSSPVPGAPVLSLGDGGTVTLTFSTPIADGPGPDFAVFENGFAPAGTSLFAELAFVEVSSDGVRFVRFPAVSETPAVSQTGGFGTLDPSHLHNLAGKHPAGYGTPFDLAELGTPGEVDLMRITHVRIIDVVGDVTGVHGTRDARGHPVNDPFPTAWQTSGFDLDAVGVIHHSLTELPALGLAVLPGSVVLDFVHPVTMADTSIALQQSPDGTVWRSAVVSVAGSVTGSDNATPGVAVRPDGSWQVTTTLLRSGAGPLFRLRLQRLH